MDRKYLDQIELKLYRELGHRGKLRDGATPAIKKACGVSDIYRGAFPCRAVRMDAATAHTFRKTCVQRQANIAPALDQVFSLWVSRPAGVSAQAILEAAPLDPVLSTLPDSFGAKVHPVAWSAMGERARADGVSLEDATRAAVRYWIEQPSRVGEQAAVDLRKGWTFAEAKAKADPAVSPRGRGRPSRESAVVPIMIHYEAPLAGRLRRYVSRYGIKQREVLHLALEAWLRAAPYGDGDPDAGGPSCREIEPLASPAPAPVTRPAGTSGENPASQAPPVDLL